ncbi:ABC transporter [Psychrobacillus sp. INOP01]|uniref:ABC transporter n=1 Tax=Psychrobacillus sp. INOP01 TaxID=2829187 RepID=UPI001BADCC2D|nr:ABC transporter [Psychrobacillus sp. INOP01]QUG43644.1 ABC transporter [Psychrobacillus sp. INOP01]
MRNMLKTLYIIEKTDRKNIFACLIVALCVIGMVVFANTQELGNPIKEKSSESLPVKVAMNKFQIVDASEYGDGSDIYKNIVKQYYTYPKQGMALKTEQPELFIETAIELTELRKQAFEMDNYELIAGNLPTKIENEMDSAYYQYLKEHNLALSFGSLSFYPFLAFLFSVVGSVWFVLICIYASNIMIDDFRHTSLIKGYPIAFSQYVLAKCMTSMGIVFIFIFELIVCSLPLLYFKGLGQASYPVAVFNGEVMIYPIYKYIAVSIVYMICLAVFAILLSVILNVLLKNVYLTIFVQIILVVIPILFPSLIELIPFNPFNYVNFPSVLNGDSLNLATPVALNSNVGLVYICISIILLMAIIKWFLSTGKLQKI